MTVVRLLEAGLPRILSATVGMTFIVDKFTIGNDGRFIAHIRDYRHSQEHRGFQVWSIGPEGYEIIS